jgi:hypothetical protein
LEHLVPGSMNDALAGDLAEEFPRRGAAWYWRQVLLAVAVGFFRHLRDEWGSIAFVFVWLFVGGKITGLVYSWIYPWIFPRPSEPWVRYPWPFSIMAKLGFVVILQSTQLILGLAIYLAVAHRFTFRGSMEGAAVSIGALVACDVAIIGLEANFRRLAWPILAVVYPLVLLAGIWVGQRRRRNVAVLA